MAEKQNLNDSSSQLSLQQWGQQDNVQTVFEKNKEMFTKDHFLLNLHDSLFSTSSNCVDFYSLNEKRYNIQERKEGKISKLKIQAGGKIELLNLQYPR